MSDSKNDNAWEKIFDKYKILEGIKNNNQFVITSKQINEFREARLMTKFDYRSQLPSLFLENTLSILPISRGSYIISDFEMFESFDDNEIDVINYLSSIGWELEQTFKIKILSKECIQYLFVKE